MSRIGDKGKGGVLNLSLAEMAFLLVFALAIVVAPQQAKLAQLEQELDRVTTERDELVEDKKLRSNIPEPCEGYWMDIVAVSGDKYCVEGSVMSLPELIRRYGAHQREVEERGDCKVRIRFYSEGGLSADAVFSAQRALRSQFYYREESGTRSCESSEE